MSVVIVAFEGAPKFSPDAKARDEELNELIRSKVTGRFSTQLRFINY